MDRDIATERATRIAELNDVFRRSVANTVITPGVMVLEDVLGLMRRVYEYKDFNEDNDPYGEHDFGSFDWHGEKIFWKINYYEKEYQYYCDPLSPECKRVMTVMLAEEY